MVGVRLLGQRLAASIQLLGPSLLARRDINPKNDERCGQNLTALVPPPPLYRVAGAARVLSWALALLGGVVLAGHDGAFRQGALSPR